MSSNHPLGEPEAYPNQLAKELTKAQVTLAREICTELKIQDPTVMAAVLTALTQNLRYLKS